MYNVCLSSEIYRLAPEDLLVLPDAPAEKKDSHLHDDVVILIGDEKKQLSDTLLKGREAAERAIAEKQSFIPVRIAFEPRTGKFDFLSPLIRSLRYKHKSFSPNIYHTDPFDIRRLKIERSFRTRENAYTFTKKKNRLAENMRSRLYEELYNSMKEKGFDDRFPIEIMLCRSLGVQDTVDQGHHRMSVAIDCGLPRISVRFGAAGKAPAPAAAVPADSPALPVLQTLELPFQITPDSSYPPDIKRRMIPQRRFPGTEKIIQAIRPRPNLKRIPIRGNNRLAVGRKLQLQQTLAVNHNKTPRCLLQSPDIFNAGITQIGNSLEPAFKFQNPQPRTALKIHFSGALRPNSTQTKYG